MKIVLILLTASALVTGCQARREPAVTHGMITPPLLSQAKTPRDLLGVNSILIAPPELDQRARSIEPARGNIYAELDQAAREQIDMQLVSGEEVEAALRAGTSRESLRAVARRFGGDAVLQTTILRYVEREGSAVGATTPAAVDFSMSLLRASDGKEVWSASYHFQDEFLSENLFKAKQRFDPKAGAGWRNARELLADGFRSAFKELSTSRFEQFSGMKTEG